MSLQSVVRWLLPREDRFYGFLEGQAHVAREGAVALAKFKEADATAEGVSAAVQALEHQGDKLVHEMEEALAKTFVTPIDREDLQRLSSQLDSVLDLTNAAARASVLYGLARPTEPMRKLIDILLECVDSLDKAMPALRKHAYQELIEAKHQIHKLEKSGDRVFRDAVSALFHDEAIDAKVLLREREVLEDLENAIDYCEHVADTLTNLAIKHG
jgi:uncharacterized protein Yka (UPF0111/DUF47 family)